MTMDGPSRRTLLAGALLVALCAAAPWCGTLDHPFLHDDRWAVVDNPLVDGEVDLASIFTSNSWGNRPEYPHMHYRPLSVLTLSVTRALWGAEPAPFRATNVALHVAVCVLLFWFLARLGIRPVPAFAGALWFAVHPLHSEAVLFVVNREELMAGLFYLGALFALLPSLGVAPGGTRSLTPARAALVGGLTLLGLLSKESAATAPILVLALAVAWPLRPRLSWSRALALSGGLVLVLVAYLALRHAVLGRLLSDFIPWQDNPLVLADGATRVAGALAVLAESARLLVAPIHLTVDYGFNVLGLPVGAWSWRAAAGAGVLAGLAFAAFRGLCRYPLVTLGILLGVVAWAPFSNLLFPNSIILSERNLYLPSLGAAVALAALLHHWSSSTGTRPLAGKAAVAVTLAACLVLGTLSWDRATDYRSAEALFASSLANRPGSTRLHNNLGLQYLKTGRPSKAEAHLGRSLHIDPANADAHNNLGLLLGGTGRPRDAAMAFTLALRHRPGMVPALTNLCWLLVRTGEYEAADDPCRLAFRRGGPVGEAVRRIETRGQSGRNRDD